MAQRLLKHESLLLNWFESQGRPRLFSGMHQLADFAIELAPVNSTCHNNSILIDNHVYGQVKDAQADG
jgi:hypothetical protein